MSIAKVGQADAAAASVALPAFSVGDLAVLFAFNANANTVPTAVAGWTIITNGTGNTTGFQIAYRVLQSGDTTTGTWTNASHIEVIVLSGAQAAPSPIGAGLTNTGASAAPNWPVWTASDGSARSWLVLFGGHRTATDMNTVALGSTTNESPSTGALALHTARGVASWASTSKTVNANSGWRTYGIEVIAQGETHRFTQETTEVLAFPTDEKARNSQETSDVLLLPIPKGRNSYETAEVLLTPIAFARNSQETVDVLVLPITTLARITQEATDVLLMPSDQKARLSAITAEVLRKNHYDQCNIEWVDLIPGGAMGPGHATPGGP